jgi:hypothetical protein
MEALPEDFVLYTEWPEFQRENDFPAMMHAAYVGDAPRGLRRGIWPLFSEAYVSDTEPSTALPGPSRFILWQRLMRTDVPAGWRHGSLVAELCGESYNYAIGYVRLSPDHSHFLRWAPAEKPRLKRWREELLGKAYAIETIDPETFWNAYQGSDTWKKIDRFYLTWLHTKLFEQFAPHGTVECRVARNLHTGEVVAGMATLGSQPHKSSYYFIGFLCEAGREDHAMTGMMHDWFVRSVDKGCTHLHLGQFWDKSSPKNWRGFSDFKAKFGTEYIHFPPTLYRFVRGSR